jgi:Right handed beta helix region
MNKLRFTFTAVAVMAFLVAVSSSAMAQATRTWVSGTGDDANPCSRTAPCKTFAGAISKTASPGEINAIDTGGYGAVTITKSIKIDGTGTFASVLFSGVNGVIVNAATTDTVVLRGISFNGSGTTLGVDAVKVLQAKQVTIEDCDIWKGSGSGIEIAASANTNMTVRNTSVKDFTGGGLKVDTSSGIARVAVDHSSFSGCGQGVLAHRSSRITVKDSALVNNGVGAFAEGNGAIAIIFLKACEVAQNSSNGVQAGGGASTTLSVVRMSENVIDNNTGIGASVQANGEIDTFMNNEIVGNGTNGCPSCTNSSGSFN